MEIVIKGRHCEISERFREHVHEKLQRIEKYDTRKKIIRLDVEVTKEPNPRQHDHAVRIEVTVRSRGPAIRAEAAASDRMAALDACTDKLEARLRKAVDRQRFHHSQRRPATVNDVIGSDERIESLEGALQGNRGEDESSLEQTHKVGPLDVMGDGPLVVREKTHVATPMTLDQALYEMEMVGHDFYLFTEKDSGHPSVVYRRRGYDYGVIHLASAGDVT